MNIFETLFSGRILDSSYVQYCINYFAKCIYKFVNVAILKCTLCLSDDFCH